MFNFCNVYFVPLTMDIEDGIKKTFVHERLRFATMHREIRLS